MGRNLAGTSIGLWTQCDQLPHTAPLSLTAHYSCLYSSSCEPKYTLLLFRGFYQVIWSQGEGEQWLIYRKVLDGGQHAPLLPSGPPCHVLSPPLYFLLPFVCFFSPALPSRLPLLCLSAGFRSPSVMCHAQRMAQSGCELPDCRVRILSVFAFRHPPHHLAQRPGDILVSSGV